MKLINPMPIFFHKQLSFSHGRSRTHHNITHPPPIGYRVRVRLGFMMVLAAAFFTLAGCATKAEWDRFWNSGKHEQPESHPRQAPKSMALRGTIAPLVTIQGMRLNQVRGFGLVLDLIDTGGKDGPEMVRKYLIKEIQRQQKVDKPTVSPASLLNTRDSVIVEINGFVPAGARKGDRFDVSLRALGTEAQSLVGGRLMLGDLRLYAETSSGVLSGKILAKAMGQVFVSPFDRHGKPTNHVNLREGVILGGGVVTKPRKIRLVLNDPRHSIASQIERRINSRYAENEPIAIGESSGVVALKIPRKYHNRKSFFLARVLHTTLNGNVAFLNKRTGELIRELKERDSDGNAIGLALEAIGKVVLPALRPLYGDPVGKINYFAARTGLRLEDREALATISQHAKDPGSPYRNSAINELGWAVRMYGAGECLRQLLDDSDSLIRIEAYRALRRRSHPAIKTRIMDQDNFILDVLDSKGDFLIYVQRTNAPRIALFGKQMRCKPPVMFPGDRSDGRRLITQLSADVGDTSLTFKYTNKRNGRISPNLSAPLEVAELIKYLGAAPYESEKWKQPGYAVPYSEIVDILSTLCETKTIPADFVLEGLEDQKASENAINREESEF